MFWMRNKENNFPIRTLIWRPGPVHKISVLKYNNPSSRIEGSGESVHMHGLTRALTAHIHKVWM